jgi:hypothetical protein
MPTIVEIGAVEGFILDDPVAGVLDNTDYTLGGVVFSDITDKVIDVSIARGKNRELDRFAAGALTVNLNNEDRAFDPLYPSGTYSSFVIPRREIRVSTDGVREFTGVIDDWNFAYSPDGRSRAEIVATDDFTLLARQQVTAGTATTQLSGARVLTVLNQDSVNWPAGRRNIDEGTSVLGTDVFEGNALEYLQKVETSEQGQLFIDKSGNLTFKGRLDATPTSDSLTVFADDGTGIPFTLTSVNYGTELLVNTAEVTSAAGTAIASNSRSATVYGISSQSLNTLVDSEAQLTNIADFIVSKYADPEYRFDAIRINLDTLSPAYKADVLALEIGDVIEIIFTPNRIGPPIEQYGQIIRIDNDISITEHNITIGVASLDYTFLVLNDSVFGTIDNNALAF